MILQCILVSVDLELPILYGVPNVSKALTNAIFVYLPLIYKYDTDLAKYLSDLYLRPIYITARYIINMGQIYIPEMDLYIWA